MINVCFINGSPKANPKSNSDHFINELSKSFSKDVIITRYYASKIINDMDALDKISSSDKIIFAAPLYADTLPSQMIKFLTVLEDYLKNKNISNLEVYAMINCGFYEGTQCKYALDMIKYFSRKSNLNWKFGLAIGGGEYLYNTSDDSIHAQSLYQAFKVLSDSVNNNQTSQKDNIVLSPDKMNAFIYRTVANIGWCLYDFPKCVSHIFAKPY